MHKSTEEFDKLYGILNDQQKKAVDTIEGPVMVIAGPGTGKTQILTLRIANILKNTDVPADAILALTFTNAAAANMRKRLVSIIGSDGYRVSIFTFHSFANHLIETYPEKFSTVVGRSNCSEVERIDIVRSIIKAGRFEILKPINEPYHNVPKIISAISHLKREGLTPEIFSTWIKKERKELEASDDLYHKKGAYKGKMKGKYNKLFASLDKNQELAHLYERYQEELLRRKRYDFDDSLLLLIDVMKKNEDFLRELQEEYQYFLVDEHQDTNGAQNTILELLATFFDSPNLFVVGDEKQAIFRFQGASLENFLYFEKKFKDVKRITLETNYRSHQGVLDAGGAIIEKSKEGIQAPLNAYKTSAKKDNLRIKTFTFGSDDEELLFLAESIKNKIDDGVPAHEIAVLFRNNRDADDISDYFERLGIPFLIESGHGVLDDPDIRKLNLILRSLRDLSDDDALANVLFIGFLKIDIPDVYTILNTSRKNKTSIFDTLVNSKKLKLKNHEAVYKLTKQLINWKKTAENNTFLHLFETVVRESGLLEHIQNSSFHTEKFDKLVRLFDEMKSHLRRNPFFNTEDYETFLKILEEHNITLEAKSRHVPNSVHLMTAHKAKGLEFDYVFIVHAYDGHWGGKRNYKYFKIPHKNGEVLEVGDDTEDERRLFYVAITRARKDVFISYASLSPDGKDRVPSQFVEEIHTNLKTEKDGEELGYAGKRPPLFVERLGRHGKEKYLEFVKSVFEERGISATALNNYLTCPWKWFYESFFHTQFVPSTQQVKGTVVHKALEEYFKARNTNSTLGKDFLIETFNKHMEETDLEQRLLERIVKETGASLSGWYDKWNQSWTLKTKNEILVRGVLLDDKIRLTGKFDKLECLDDKCHLVDVIDYKTGKPRSRNEIEGKTKSAKAKAGSGGYKRQLVFYKLLLDKYADGMYKMNKGVLDFVEPSKSGSYKKEEFTIEKHEVDELSDEIRRVSKEITSLSFWNDRCDDPECKACALREMMD